MIKRDILSCFPAHLFVKLFLISFLLQQSLGFENFEDESPAGQQPFYHYLDDWMILRKVPRGYMVPIPRVGRRQINENKRQNMIPQPRIGRELEYNEELNHAINEILKYLVNDDFQYLSQHASSVSNSLRKGYPRIYDDIVRNLAKDIPEQEKNAFAKEDSTSMEKSEDVSGLADEGSPNLAEMLSDDPNNGILNFPLKSKDIVSQDTDTKDSGFGIFSGESQLIPLSRTERARLLAALEEKSLAGGLMAYPRLGREVWTLEDYLTNGYLGYKPQQKRARPLRLTPRIGRKKRSVTDEEQQKPPEISEKNDKELVEPDNSRAIWENIDDLADDYYYGADKKSIRSKNAFVPRIGKKWSNYVDVYDEKRAAAFTPRIGRAALIPRIGRIDPRLRLKNRAAFVPRIGRRAAFVPRIGRSIERQRTSTSDDTD